MTLMAFLQISYLVINIVGLILSLFAFCVLEDLEFIERFFSFVEKHLGNVPLAIISIIVIALFLPTLACIAAVVTFLIIWGTYSN